MKLLFLCLASPVLISASTASQDAVNPDLRCVSLMMRVADNSEDPDLFELQRAAPFAMGYFLGLARAAEPDADLGTMIEADFDRILSWEDEEAYRNGLKDCSQRWKPTFDTLKALDW